jgi:ATP-dependent protease ClpP protease subunit
MRKVLVITSLILISCFTTTIRPMLNRLQQEPIIAFEGTVDVPHIFPFLFTLETRKQEFQNRVLIQINSPGGYVDDGIRLAKYLENYPVPTICIVDGNAASMGFYILQSCTQRYMTKRSSLMVHNPEPVVAEAKDDPKYNKMLKIISDTMLEHEAHRLTIGVGELREILSKGDYYLNWQEALRIGAVDNVVESEQITNVFYPGVLKVPLD